MEHGICHLSIVPMRLNPADSSEMISQVLYGEHFKILEIQKKWTFIRLSHDNYEGWIDNKQYKAIDAGQYDLAFGKQPIWAADLLQMLTCPDGSIICAPLGASVTDLDLTGDAFDGRSVSGKKDKAQILDTALLYLKCPYLWGGRTPFGLDCSGFTQMVYRLNGHTLYRDASQQAAQGQPLSFIEESKPGDLAFFDNEEGTITHVGIMMADNYIIHAHGEVRIDRLDHTGIYNAERQLYTHKLRVIKKIF